MKHVPSAQAMMSEPATQPGREIHRGDPRQRRRALWLLLAFLVVSALAVSAVREHTRDLGQRLYGDSRAETLSEARISFRVAVGLLLVPGFGLAWWVWRTAARSESEGRFPPSSARTLRDVPVRRGRSLRTIVRGHRLLASAVVGILLVLVLVMELLLARLG
ncbi:MAG TPA: hypothetical protein PKZ76_12000 [Xanthomonadaceae bacterium]|nr:hypothetical protein [Xanthomonadaceae bacterium]